MVNTPESRSAAAAFTSVPVTDTEIGSAPDAGQRTRARIALIGTGGRSEMYIRAIFGKHADTAELAAFSDVNPGRVEFYQKIIQ